MLLLAACGQQKPVCVCGSSTTASMLSCNTTTEHCEGGFTQIGHSDVLARGQNAGLAIAGHYAYVGSRTDGYHMNPGVQIIDIADPTNPMIAGVLGPPYEGVLGVAPLELRAVPDKNLLIVMNQVCDPSTNDCGYDLSMFPTTGGVAETANLKLYDISDPIHPKQVGLFDFGFDPQVYDNRSNPHEFFVWEDPLVPGRVIVYITALPGDPNLRAIDVTDPANPVVIATWDTFREMGLPRAFFESMHSLSISDDGKVA